MKKILFIAVALIVLCSCKEDDSPYYGYAAFEDNLKVTSRVIVDQQTGSQEVPLFTDQKSGTVVPVEGSEWCSGTVKDGVFTLNFTANETGQTREGKVDVYLGMHHLKLDVIQRTTGVNHIEILNPDEGDPLRWTAECSDVQSGDGGGLNTIFTDDQTSFWHSQYSPATSLPHWIVVDLKEEMDINQVRLGWRMYGANVYIHVRKVIIETSNDGINFTPTGGEIFREPVDNKLSSPNYPKYTNCEFDAVKARYVRLMMTESNSGSVCHVAYFKVYMP